MAIVLEDHVISAKLLKSGSDPAISVSAGQIFKVETSPNGEEILNVECPAGKSWSVRVIVEIRETDV